MSQQSEKIKQAVAQIRKLKAQIDHERTLIESGKIPVEEVQKIQKILLLGFSKQEVGKKESERLLRQLLELNKRDFDKTINSILASQASSSASVIQLLRAFQEVKLPKIEDFSQKVTQPLQEELKSLAKSLSGFLPTDAENPISVRLSNGKDFYEALTQFFGSTGGGSSTPTVPSTVTPAIRGVPVVNPDGTNILAIDAGKTLLSAGGSASSSGNNTLVAAGTNRLKVYAFSLSTISTTAVTCIFQSGASGTELWRVRLQTPDLVAGGANLVVQPPAWIFATASATLLNLNLSAAVTVHWSVSYFNEA